MPAIRTGAPHLGKSLQPDPGNEDGKNSTNSGLASEPDQTDPPPSPNQTSANQTNPKFGGPNNPVACPGPTPYRRPSRSQPMIDNPDTNNSSTQPGTSERTFTSVVR